MKGWLDGEEVTSPTPKPLPVKRTVHSSNINKNFRDVTRM